MRRPTACPDCGASATAHTGPYCHECGFVLVQPPPVRPVWMGRLREAELLGEKWIRSSDDVTRRLGADLLQVLRD